MPPKLEKSLWPYFAAFTVAVIIVAAIRWSLAHPYGIHWDEAEYLNWVAVDLQRLYSGMLLRLGGRILSGAKGFLPHIASLLFRSSFRSDSIPPLQGWLRSQGSV